jgi:hypothetical protein
LDRNFSLVIGFFSILIIGELVFSLGLAYIYSHFAKLYIKSSLLARLDKYLGIFPSVLVGLFLVSICFNLAS